MILEGLKIYGTSEIVGSAHNPVILAWADECGIKGYHADEIPWCGLAMAVVAKRAGKPVVASPLWARNWNKWGKPVKVAMLGDILVFSRASGGHVGLYVGEDKYCYHVMGGNQSNAYNITRIAKSRCIGIRRHYAVGMPANVRRIFLEPTGAVSVDED